MKNKSKNKLMIGFLAILIGLSVGIVLASSEGIKSAPVVATPTNPSWRDILNQTKKSIGDSFRQAKAQSFDLVKQASDQTKAILSEAKTGVRTFWLNQLKPIINKSAQDIAATFSAGLAETSKALVDRGTAGVTNLTAKGVQGIQDVSNSAVNWINKNMGPEKAQQAAAQIQQQAAVAVQGVLDQGERTVTTTASSIAEAAQSAEQQIQGSPSPYVDPYAEAVG
jgi:hypothetical protein